MKYKDSKRLTTHVDDLKELFMAVCYNCLIPIGIHLLPFPEIRTYNIEMTNEKYHILSHCLYVLTHFLNASSCLPVQFFFSQRPVMKQLLIDNI